jgi:hypothetical protein
VTPIDLCISLSGPLVDVLLPITLETLKRHDSMDGVTLHLVDKDCAHPVKRHIASLSQHGNAKIYSFTSPPRFKDGCPKTEKEAELDVVNGTVTTLNYMAKYCGTSEWVFISHFDLEFKAPWLSYYRGKIAESVGQIGDHAVGLVGYNRNAIKQCEVGFGSMSGFFIVKDHQNNLKLRHGSDPRCVDKTMPLTGWDTNELLELNMQHFGWRIVADTDDQSRVWRVHNGSGSGRCGDTVNQLIRSRAVNDLSRLQIQPIT